MTTPTAIVVLAAFVLFALIMWAYVRKRERATYMDRFGPEYERLERERGRQGAASELRDRSRRVEHLSIRALEPTERTRFADQWRQQQARFVDDPNGAVTEADRLVADVMRTRGYPVGDFDQRAADISVDHPRVVENYRAAHDLAVRQQRGQASAEDLRGAMIYYRALFEELLEQRPGSDVSVR
jgi:hypothetical protein